ncbi:MAG: hypothetical protein PWQ41_1871 [Bacillota bacterium]|jgi:hypothetical protein|nr:hypothetical protein [Bacillota bacterium]MDK2856805.1 hypothetical protein [Bacillota bacterium]MDK2926097.1 hypothetical protein [Bacillota bacterium]
MRLSLLRRLIALLFDPRVPKYKKQLFLLLTLAYWLAPDLMPFLPLDDLLFTLLGSWLFLQSAQRDVAGGERTATSRSDTPGDFIDVHDYVVHEDGKR